ncbi:hypothetical protein G6F56_013339 [Rhizopus delemar]|nr:hypothetical protein G6F56_013339 [Rhizopus delemar]
MTTPEENLTLNDLLEKHKEEQKQLTTKIIALRKSAPKSDKRKKREINSRIADLEYNLKTQQEEEIRALKAKEAGLDPNETQNEEDDGISMDLLDKLTIQHEEQEQGASSQPKVKKVNKAKLRIEKRNAEMERLREEAEKEAANQVDQGVLETEAIKELLVPMNLRIKQITADGHW